jgi:hypothetical protein
MNRRTVFASRARGRALAGPLSLLLGGVLAIAASVAGASGRPAVAATPAERHVYYTGGVHNDKDCIPLAKCLYPRKAGEPTDPQYPKWWVSTWTMYRVFANYDKYPPPYGNPPAGLSPSDYQVSYGASYYDATYVPKDRDGTGAMMEYYDQYCLPIFPSDNHFTCAFVSLGNKAYFLRYADRPKGTPQCCKFSPKNHPPRVDFIQHLPYSPARSAQVGGQVQAYALEVGKPPILFGYAFYATPTSDDPANPKSPKYRHPQSFYFSGYPLDPPNAPIVSQNYTSFRAQRPDPIVTWDQVAQMCPADPEWCCLFEGDCPKKGADAAPAAVRGAEAPAQWSDLEGPQTGGAP